VRNIPILFLIAAALCSSAPAQSVTPNTRTLYFTAVDKKGQPAAVTGGTLEAAPGKSVQGLGLVPINYMLALDVSNSSRDRFAAQQKLAKKILAEVVRPQIDTGFLVLFDNKVYPGRGVTTEPELIAKALDYSRPRRCDRALRRTGGGCGKICDIGVAEPASSTVADYGRR
jgi:hypothetical protein